MNEIVERELTSEDVIAMIDGLRDQLTEIRHWAETLQEKADLTKEVQP